jgi:hypothetical protein
LALVDNQEYGTNHTELPEITNRSVSRIAQRFENSYLASLNGSDFGIIDALRT